MKIDRFAIGVALQLFFLTACGSSQAQGVVRVEEDWALQVNEPDEQLDSPQITTSMMPLGPDSKWSTQVWHSVGPKPNLEQFWWRRVVH